MSRKLMERAGLVAAGAAVTGGLFWAYKAVVEAGPAELTQGQISTAAQNLANLCMTSTVDGNENRTGNPKETFDILQKFAGGISCRVIDSSGSLVSVTVSNTSSSGPNGEPTRITMYAEPVPYNNDKDTASSWNFSEVAKPASGIDSAIEGFATSTGAIEVSSVGALAGKTFQTETYGSGISLVNGNGTISTPNLGAYAFDLVENAATSIMAQAVPPTSH